MEANGANPFELEEKDVIYRSLKHYENQIRIMKGAIKLITIQHHRELKKRAFRKVREFIRN